MIKKVQFEKDEINLFLVMSVVNDAIFFLGE